MMSGMDAGVNEDLHSRSPPLASAHVLSLEKDTVSNLRARDPSMPNERRKNLYNGRRFWAVVIGINDYPHDPILRPLLGAVSDAMSMYAYLTDDLQVPPSNIRLVAQGSDSDMPHRIPPTRENILDTLYHHLRDNTAIGVDDNILIYFAGHGSVYSASSVSGSAGTQEGSIEALCPMDRGLEMEDGVIPEISDREMNIIVSELYEERRANITLIYDCCFAGGMSRSADEEYIAVRAGEPLADPAGEPLADPAGEPLADTSRRTQLDILLSRADNDQRRKPGGRKASLDAYQPDTSSFVLLAACKEYERAHEFRSRTSGAIHGVFTHHLLIELRASSNQTTYSDLIKRLQSPSREYPLSLQRAHIVGGKMDCRLWYAEGEQSTHQVGPSRVGSSKAANGATPKGRTSAAAVHSDESGSAASVKRVPSDSPTISSGLGQRYSSKSSSHSEETPPHDLYPIPGNPAGTSHEYATHTDTLSQHGLNVPLTPNNPHTAPSTNLTSPFVAPPSRMESPSEMRLTYHPPPTSLERLGKGLYMDPNQRTESKGARDDFGALSPNGESQSSNSKAEKNVSGVSTQPKQTSVKEDGCKWLCCCIVM